MICLVFLACLVGVISAQYPYSQNNVGYQQPYQHQPQHGPGNSAGAPVHYVNIGAQLQGDYKFGYNTGNGGSFREETRLPDGSVQGAYGYIDASGKQKVIKYTAGKEGFKAEGEDIPQAPPAPQQPVPQQAPYHHQQAPPQNHYNNYVQPQPPQPPQHNYNQYQPQQNSYNPYAYTNPANPQGNQQLSYNIGSGGQYQG